VWLGAVRTGALKLHDLKMTDQNRKAGKCKTWKMTDQIAVLVLENAYFFLVKILSLVHSAADLQAQNAFFSVAVKR